MQVFSLKIKKSIDTSLYLIHFFKILEDSIEMLRTSCTILNIQMAVCKDKISET